MEAVIEINAKIGIDYFDEMGAALRLMKLAPSMRYISIQESEVNWLEFYGTIKKTLTEMQERGVHFAKVPFYFELLSNTMALKGYRLENDPYLPIHSPLRVYHVFLVRDDPEDCSIRFVVMGVAGLSNKENQLAPNRIPVSEKLEPAFYHIPVNHRSGLEYMLGNFFRAHRIDTDAKLVENIARLSMTQLDKFYESLEHSSHDVHPIYLELMALSSDQFCLKWNSEKVRYELTSHDDQEARWRFVLFYNAAVVIPLLVPTMTQIVTFDEPVELMDIVGSWLFDRGYRIIDHMSMYTLQKMFVSILGGKRAEHTVFNDLTTLYLYRMDNVWFPTLRANDIPADCHHHTTLNINLSWAEGTGFVCQLNIGRLGYNGYRPMVGAGESLYINMDSALTKDFEIPDEWLPN